jgi:hypothetical protein
MSNRKKPGVAFWGTVVVVVALVAYPLSVGPAEWMRTHGWLSRGAMSALKWFYAPLAWLVTHSELFGRAIAWYQQLWTG